MSLSVRGPAMSDVAVRAGVSHQTVSRVLNGHPSVRPETRERVVEAVAALGYRRNNAARALVTRRTGTLGVVTPATALHGPASTLVGLEEAARESGWFVAVATVRGFDGETMRGVLEQFLAQGVDGLAVVAPTVQIASALDDVDWPVPVVLVSSGADVTGVRGRLAVGVDQRRGARVATRHLLAAGHASVAHVAGPQDWFDARDRLAGWADECRAAGAVMDPPIVTGWSAQDGHEAGRRLLHTGLPSAVFAANDQLALGLLHAFWEAGVRVPDDVRVVGFDDESGAAHYLPPLTTVRQDFGELGRLAIDAFRSALAGERPIVRTVSPRLVVRRSSMRRPA